MNWSGTVIHSSPDSVCSLQRVQTECHSLAQPFRSFSEGVTVSDVGIEELVFRCCAVVVAQQRSSSGPSKIWEDVQRLLPDDEFRSGSHSSAQGCVSTRLPKGRRPGVKSTEVTRSYLCVVVNATHKPPLMQLCKGGS